jgi:hypothetical protein
MFLFFFSFFFFEVGLPSIVISMLVSILKLKSRVVLCCFFFLKKIDTIVFFFYYLYSISVTSRFNPDLPHLIPNQNMVNKEKLEAEEEMCFLREQNRTRCFSRILTLLLFVT